MLRVTSRVARFAKYEKDQLKPSDKLEFLYGVNPIEVALAACRRQFFGLIISDSETVNTGPKATQIINAAQNKKIPLLFSSKDKMTRLVSGQPHQNLILKCSELEQIVARDGRSYSKGVYVYCDKITDPQNFGAIIRSCLYFGVQNVFVPKKSVCPINSTVSKTSSGASELLQVHTVQKDEQFIQQWKESGGVVITTSVSSHNCLPTSIYSIKEMVAANQKILIIIGSEGYGVSPHLSRNSTYSLTIPRTGSIEYPNNLIDSLNVNAALACILSQILAPSQR